MAFHFRKFVADDDGAVSVDWVVITAAIVILGTAVAVVVRDETILAGERIEAKMDSYHSE